MTVDIEDLTNIIDELKERQRRISYNKLELLNIHDFRNFEMLRGRILRNLSDLDSLIETSIGSVDAIRQTSLKFCSRLDRPKSPDDYRLYTISNDQCATEGVKLNFSYSAHEENKDHSFNNQSSGKSFSKLKLNFDYEGFIRKPEDILEAQTTKKYEYLNNPDLNFDYAVPKHANMEPNQGMSGSNTFKMQGLESSINNSRSQIEKTGVITDLIIQITKNKDLQAFIKRSDDNILGRLLDPNISSETIRQTQLKVDEYFKSVESEPAKESLRNEAFTLGREGEATLNHNDRTSSNNQEIHEANSHIIANSKFKTASSRTHSNSKTNKSMIDSRSGNILKPFIRFTRKNPDYFDKSYQFGGPSSISVHQKGTRSKNTSLSKISF